MDTLWSSFFGIVVYQIHLNKIPTINTILTLVLVTCCSIYFGHMYYRSIDLTYVRFLVFGLPSSLILYISLSLESKWPQSNLLTLLGDASYSIYISHTFILQTFVFSVRY